ncbi:MAG TPA: kelch repeat-containing protein, partial [Myxococcales bacterium]
TARCNAAAALVSATQVLIAGGDNCANTTALMTWDLWDSTAASTPVSNTGANKLTVGRRLFTATVVGTGKVLLAGGAATATADLFTLGAPSTVAPTTSGMLVTRFGHTATLLTSSTATTACPTATATSSCVLIAGGNSNLGKTWEIYDASTNTFPRNATTAGADLVLLARQFHAAAAFANGKVLLAGGSDGATAQSTTEVFDPAATTLSFTAGLGLQLPRFRTAAAYAPAQDVLVLIGGNAVGPSTEQVITP